MSISGILGQRLELIVVSCHKLFNTEWIARQDPYVCIEYGSSKFRTRTCTDGGKNPTFHEKFVLNLIEGVMEFSVVVWNSNTLTYDDLIGSGKIHLHKVLSTGYDDCSWVLQNKKGRNAGEIKLVMRYSNVTEATKSLQHLPSAPPFAVTPLPQVPHYSAPPHVAPHAQTNVPEPASHPFYPPIPAGHALSPYDQAATYPPAYPPGPDPSLYPPSSTYPPPPQDPNIYPPPSQGLDIFPPTLHKSNLYPPAPYPPAPYPPPHH